MGRLVSPSRPKSPPQVVYIAPPAAAPDPVIESEKNEEHLAAEKAENLLRRNRSRLGTVLTGFRGILGQNSLPAPRKTLLGE